MAARVMEGFELKSRQIFAPFFSVAVSCGDRNCIYIESRDGKEQESERSRRSRGGGGCGKSDGSKRSA